MVGVHSRTRRRLAARFSRLEVRHMEMLLQEGKNDLSDPKFHQKLADEFNARGRNEKKDVQIQQIQRWFLNRRNIEKIVDVSSSSSSKEMDPAGVEILPNNAPQCFDSSKDITTPERKTFHIADSCDDISEGFEMEFEAKSYRDQAWYDVSTFLAHRVLSSGEIEVRVRFVGFGPEEDEWVNATNAVRDRSVPMESSECWRVNEGDLLLCFREKDEAAYYFDARVISIERRSHAMMRCSCTFSVQYYHDQVEETVQLSQLCRRP